MNPKFKFYSSDTDSIMIETIFNLEAINKDLIGSNLEEWKLEKNFKKALFLAPKVYGGITNTDQMNLKFKGMNKRIQSLLIN